MKSASPINEIKERLSILDVVSPYVPLTKAGRNYKGLCPFHNEKTPSFMVSPDLKMFKCFGCFPKGSLIKTPNGSLPIDMVQVGDSIVSGKGRSRKVLHTHKRLYEGNLVEVTVRKLALPVSLTEDHEVFTVGQGCTRQYKNLSRRLTRYEKLPSAKKAEKIKKYFPIHKVTAKTLTSGNALLYPINREVRDLSHFDLSPYYTKILPKHGTKPKKINLVIPVEKDFLELVGWFLAEGSTHRAYLRFSFGDGEKKPAYEVYRCIKRLFGLTATLHYRKGTHSGIELTVCHSQLANIFENLFGRGAENKHLPSEFLYLPVEKQRILLRACWRGDGTRGKRCSTIKHAVYSVTTVSRTLQEQVRDVLLRLGYFPSVCISNEFTDKNNVHHKQAYTVTWLKSTKSQKYNLVYTAEDGAVYWVLPVRKALKSLFKGVVYNLNVAEDNSYVANTFAVSNCGVGGDLFEFIQQIEGVGFSEALKILGDKAGVEVKVTKKSEGDKEESRRTRLLEINLLAAEFYNYVLTKHQIGASALEYLHKRGITDKTIKEFKLGYAPNSWHSASDFLLKRGKRLEDVVTTGIAVMGDGGRAHDRFRGRITIPFFNLSGEVVGFTGRDILGIEPKYLNSPESEVFNKSNFVFGLYSSRLEIKKADLAVVVEGQFDWLAPWQAGIKNIVASGGTALTVGQLNLIKRYTKNLSLCFDGDRAGDIATRRAISVAENLGFNVRLIVIPKEFKDPDECVRRNKEVFISAIKNALNAYDWYLQSAAKRFDLTDAVGKKEAGNFLLPILREIKNPIEQSHYLQKVAEMLGVSIEVINKSLTTTKAPQEKDFEVSSTLSSSTQPLPREEFLLALLLKAPVAEVLSILDNLTKADFSTGLQGRFEFLREQLLLDPELNINALLAKSSEPDYWQNLFFQDTGDFKLEIIEELAQSLRHDSLKRQMSQLSKLMKQAEIASDHEKIKKLEVEFKEISGKLSSS